MSVIERSITRRECAKCGAAIGGVHADECPVDRHAPIVEVEYVRADAYRGAVEERDRLREVLRAVLMEPDPIKRNQLAAPVLRGAVAR
jgi:hypothetical protein